MFVKNIISTNLALPFSQELSTALWDLKNSCNASLAVNAAGSSRSGSLSLNASNRLKIKQWKFSVRKNRPIIILYIPAKMA